jgi:putative transposase
MDMPRPPRPADAPDAVFHVTARVNWRVFHLEPHACVSTFYRFLRESLIRFGVDLLAYVLMSNHFHLVVRSPDSRLFRKLTTRRLPCRHYRPWRPGHQKRSVRAQFMRYLMQRTATVIQKDLGISGHLWEKSYHAREILDDVDLVTTIAYDHLNPVEASMVQTPEEYRRSSALWWHDGSGAPVALLQRPMPFGLTPHGFREQLLAYQGDRAFRDAMAEFHASGEELGTWKGLDALKRVLASRGVLRTADSNVRTLTSEPVAQQQLTSARPRT